MQRQLQRVDTQPEQGDKGLLYPSRLFAVWFDDAQGQALPYKMDEHTFERTTHALQAACAWVRSQAGNRALVYQRDSGNVIARYASFPGGLLSCRMYSTLGNLLWERNGYAFDEAESSWIALLVGRNRQRIKTTLYVEEAQLYLAWEDYSTAKRALLQCLVIDGLSTKSFKQALLADMLAHFGWALTDEDTRGAESRILPAGTISLPLPFYDAEHMYRLLSALGTYLLRGSYLKARAGERRFAMQFRRGYEPHVLTEAEERPRQDRPAPLPVHAITHPDAGTPLEAHSLAELEQGALEIVLWYLLFVLRGEEFAGWRYEERPPNESAIWKVLSLAVPRSDESARLQVLIDFAPRFFADAATIYPLYRPLAPAELVRENAWQHLRRLCHEHWPHLLEQARFLACE